MAVNKQDVDHCNVPDLGHDLDPDRRFVDPEADIDVLEAVANIDVDDMVTFHDDFDQLKSRSDDSEPTHKRLFDHRFVHLPCIYMLAQHWLMKHIRY